MAKVKKRVVRRGNEAKLAEEKNVGSEIIDWTDIAPDRFSKSVYEAMRHYSYFYGQKDYVSWTVDWVKSNRPSDLKSYKAGEDWRTSSTLGSLVRIHSMGAPIPESYVDFINKQIDTVVSFGKINIESAVEEVVSDAPAVKKKNPSELLREKTLGVLGEIEGFIDEHLDGSLDKNFSLYTHLKGIDAAAQTARDIAKAYREMEAELTELIVEKTEDLVEGYSHLTLSQQKKLLKLVSGFISDSEKFVLSKKATRKPRAKRATPATKQAEKVIYQKESTDYKITSTSPAHIVGATEVYLFNTKTRVLKYLVTDKREGFIISGTSIKNYDKELSFKKKLRKPEETIDSINKVTRIRALKAFKALKTAETPTDARINSDTIILKVNK
tara:strand:- start:102 stop:1253 length:1152 start_codon:yes stop_codon:yes gene_type:complete